jgi:hypothetical protein
MKKSNSLVEEGIQKIKGKEREGIFSFEKSQAPSRD